MFRATFSQFTNTAACFLFLAGALMANPPGEVGEDGRTYVPSSNIRQTISAGAQHRAGGLNVAIVAAAGGDVDSPFYTDVRDFLLNSGEFATITIINAGEITPDLTELQQYDAVIVWSNFSFENAGALGENLSRYVDSGGGVVIAAFANSSSTAGRFLEGRWSNNDYELIPAGSGNITGNATLGTLHAPAHPLVAGVSSFDGGSSSYRPTTMTIHFAATLVADWNDGTPFVAVREDTVGSRVDLGFYPPSDNVLANYWDATTDGDALIVNAVKYAATRLPLIPGDSDADNDVDTDDLAAIDACYAIAENGDAPAGCITFDFDRDDDVDCTDQYQFRNAWTGLDPPPLSAACLQVIPTVSEWHVVCLALLILIAASHLLRTRSTTSPPSLVLRDELTTRAPDNRQRLMPRSTSGFMPKREERAD